MEKPDDTEVNKTVRNGTLGELEALLDEYPDIQNHEIRTNRWFRHASLTQIAISVHAVDKVALLLERGAIVLDDREGGWILDWIYLSSAPEDNE